MDKALRQHIQALERRIQELSHKMMLHRKTREERNRMETELRVVQQALDLRRSAVKLERQLQRS